MCSLNDILAIVACYTFNIIAKILVEQMFRVLAKVSMCPTSGGGFSDSAAAAVATKYNIRNKSPLSLCAYDTLFRPSSFAFSPLLDHSNVHVCDLGTTENDVRSKVDLILMRKCDTQLISASFLSGVEAKIQG